MLDFASLGVWCLYVERPTSWVGLFRLMIYTQITLLVSDVSVCQPDGSSSLFGIELSSLYYYFGLLAINPMANSFSSLDIGSS